MSKKSDTKKENRYSLNLNNDHDLIKIFCDSQSNFTDTVRYLIEEEIKRNGIRNLQEYIPPMRTLPDNINSLDIESVANNTSYSKDSHNDSMFDKNSNIENINDSEYISNQSINAKIQNNTLKSKKGSSFHTQ